MLWTLLVKTILACSLVAWWVKRPRNQFQKFSLYAATISTFWVVAPSYASGCLVRAVHYVRGAIRYWSLDELLLQHANMLVTLAAASWLLYRAWQVLRKPTSELISILGVDVPEAPDVCLAGIRPDAATLNWTRPSHNRPVQKFLIQVNGVNVGESRQEETAITVTGLRPSHYYNIRVIAVGPNNFQAGSQVIRLRTYRSDGRPELGNSRLPDSFQNQEPRSGQSQCAEDNGGRSQVPTIEAAPSLEPGSAAARDGSTTTSGQRRNTVNRRHSPSIASQEQPSIRDLSSDQPEASLKDLADTLEKTRREIDETTTQHTQEESEFKQLEQRLKKEREEKKRVQKEKDDATAQLKQKVKSSYEQMRQASKDKARKENQLKEKQDKLKKLRDNVDKWTTEIENMRKTREGYAAEKENLEQDCDLKVKHLDEENSALQAEYSQLETEYMDKKKQLKELEEERKKLPGSEEDDSWKDDDRKMKREFEAKRRELQSQLITETRKGQQLDGQLQMLNAHVYASTHQGINLFNQANSSMRDFEHNSPGQIRRSRAGNSLSNAAVPSPTGPYPSDSPFGVPIGFGSRSTYAAFADLQASEGLPTEQFAGADMRALTAGAPLSPTATMLLPSGILGDDFDDDPQSPGSFSRNSPPAPDHDNDAGSPASSRWSKSAHSSPPGSSQKPIFPASLQNNGDRASFNKMANSPGPQPSPPGHRLGHILSSFHRNRGIKSGEEGGPLLGSLKHGQSQSFPRQTDDTEPTSRRRTSFSSYTENRNSVGPDTLDRNGSLVPKGMLTSAKRLVPFGRVFAERDPSSPRPASMASADLPRPSTDSGSIWNRPGENNRFWSDTSLWTSRNPSRRPSIHGSPAALKTTLASADDEILDYEELKHPSQVGVIGSRPPGNRQTQESKSSLSQRLNPAAPTFIGGFFGWKDKESDSGKEKDKVKSREKSKDKVKDKEAKEKGKSRDVTTPSLDLPQGYDSSPTDSRKSRDAFSVHTTISVSESRESLTLDRALSSTLSDSNSNAKEEENVVRRLFRKGSSSKFTGLRLNKDNGLFKKSPGSTTNSDKNMSADRSSFGDFDDYGDEGLLGRSFESTTSSPAFGPPKSKETKEGRMTGWSNKFSMKKRGKDNKESLELQHAPESELDEKDV